MPENYETSFQMILHAGDARSKAMESIAKSNEYKFDEAKSLLDQAKEYKKIAHQIQTQLIQQECSGEPYELSILMVHAQDHFVMGTIAIDMAEQVLLINQKIKYLNLETEAKVCEH